MLSPDSIFDSMNVFLREGKLRERPGLLQVNPTIFDSSIIGGAMAVTPTQKTLLALSTTKAYTLNEHDDQWSVETGDLVNLTSQSVVDVAFIETAGEYVAVIADGINPLHKWTEEVGLELVVATEGVVPHAKSVCSTSRRIVALEAPHTLWWTSTLTYDAWNELNYVKVARTNDVGICVKSIGVADFVLYKERSIYLAQPRGGPDSTAFDIRFVAFTEGPAGIHAVVEFENQHMFMTPSGRIGIFNGQSAINWIADGLWLHLQRDVDPEHSHKIVGVYDLRLQCVTFWYANRDDHGHMRSMVMINIPLKGSGIDEYSAFLGRTMQPITHGFESRFNNQIDRSIVFSGDSRESFYLDENVLTDNEVEYPCMFQTGLYPMPDLKHFRVLAESFLEREFGSGSAMLKFVYSDSLENRRGTVDVHENAIIDLENIPTREYYGLNRAIRFAGLRYEWGSVNTVRYGGAVMYGVVVS